MRRTFLPLLLAGVLTLGAACGGDDDTPAATGDTTTSSTSTTEADSSSTTTSTTAADGPTTTTTAPFDGSTTPTSAAPGAGVTETALLTDVRTGTSDDDVTRVVFEFDSEAPGYDIAYVDPPITADGSGEPVEVEGAAFLQVRMEPASGVDLSSGETFEETYTGPDIVAGSGPVTEVVRTGDFEANLTWVIGLDDEVPYRVKILDAPARLVIELPSS